jgi:hypothetical protein
MSKWYFCSCSHIYILIKVKVSHDSGGIPSKSKGVPHKIQDIDQGNGGDWK